MFARIDFLPGKIREPPPEASGRGFLFALRGIHPGRDLRGLAGAFAREGDSCAQSNRFARKTDLL